MLEDLRRLKEELNQLDVLELDIACRQPAAKVSKFNPLSPEDLSLCWPDTGSNPSINNT